MENGKNGKRKKLKKKENGKRGKTENGINRKTFLHGCVVTRHYWSREDTSGER